MNELIREIEEDIRRERIDRLWQNFGRKAVWASIGVVALTIATVAWKDYREHAAMRHTSRFIGALDKLAASDYSGAIESLDKLILDKNSEYYPLAMLRKAEAQNLAGDQQGALLTYRTLAERNDAFGSLAKILGASDSAPIEVKKGEPLYYTLSEWRGWQLMQAGKKDEATDIFLKLWYDMGAPPSMHHRLSQVLQHVAPEKLAQQLTSEKPSAGAKH